MPPKPVSLGSASSSKIEAALKQPNKVEGAVIAQAKSFEELKTTWRDDLIYSIPMDWIDFEDKTFATRSTDIAEDINEMASSIESKGQQQPVKLRIRPAGKLQIVMGWTRSYASQKLGRNVLGILTNADDQTCKIWALIENVRRTDLSGRDQVLRYSALREEGISAADIAKFLGVSEQYIYSILRVKDYPVVYTALENNRLTLGAARSLAQIVSSDAISEDHQNKAITAIEHSHIKATPADIRYFVEQSKGVKPAAKTSKPSANQEHGMIKYPYFQKFENGRLVFSAKVDPAKTETKELQVIHKEAYSFISHLEKVIAKSSKVQPAKEKTAKKKKGKK